MLVNLHMVRRWASGAVKQNGIRTIDSLLFCIVRKCVEDECGHPISDVLFAFRSSQNISSSCFVTCKRVRSTGMRGEAP